MTIEQATARSRGGRGGGGPFGGGGFNAVANFKSPITQVEELRGKVSNYKQDGDTVTADLNADAVTELMNAGTPLGGRGGRGGRGRGGRGGGGQATLRDTAGTVTFSIQDGVLTKYAVSVRGTREFGGNAEKQSRTTTTEFTGIGSTKVALPADAKEIVDALVAGRTPNVFVPEPGFKKLFNGHDLTGWAGRPGHWSVEDGAITGKTTKENPAKGNNFLIAKAGDKNLIVDDFELRFSYRIIANNDRGFANSGVQYRSKDLGNFVVGGYQADFEAGSTILRHSLRRSGRRRRPRHHGAARGAGHLDCRRQEDSDGTTRQLRRNPGQDQAERLERLCRHRRGQPPPALHQRRADRRRHRRHRRQAAHVRHSRVATPRRRADDRSVQGHPHQVAEHGRRGRRRQR